MKFNSTKKRFRAQTVKSPFKKVFTEEGLKFRAQTVKSPFKIVFTEEGLKIIFLVLNCKKNNYRREQQTWLKKLPENFKYFHVQGDPSLNTLYRVQNNLITVKCDDGYLCLPQKVLMGMKIINRHFDYDYIFKTDDDINWTNRETLNLISKYLKKNPYDYGGIEIANIKNTTLCYCQWYHNLSFPAIYLDPATYFGGNFYFISKNIIKKLQHFNNYIIEDHAFGYHIGKITKNIKKLGDGALSYYHKYENGYGFYFDKKLSPKLGNTEFKFLKFSNNKIIDCLKDPPSDVIFIYNTDIIGKNMEAATFLDKFSHIENKDWWDIIFAGRTLPASRPIGPNTKEEFLMKMEGFFPVTSGELSLHFIIKKSATADMSLFLSNKISAEELFSTMKIYFTPYY
jgi:hypothetical protein